jgi:tripartite-type tricarboxylate transporter receptor subunit TctC
MNLNRHPLLAPLGALALALLPLSPAVAQAYPVKPISVIAPVDAGTPGDILSRAVGDPIGRELGQRVVIINRPGAAGIVGVEAAAKSAPDGYTLLISGDAAMINTASGRPLPYDFLRDLAPISLIYGGAQVLLVRREGPYQSLRDLVNAAKANPGKLTYGSAGVGSSIHMSSETFNQAAGIRTTHVPYKGIPQAMNDVAGGHIDFVIGGAPSIPAVRNGTHRGLAILSRDRMKLMPSLPTAIEQGVPMEAGGWYGLFAPAGAPPEVTRRLHDALLKALALPEIAERFTSLGGEPRSNTPEQFSAFLRAEIDKYSVLIKRLNLKLD